MLRFLALPASLSVKAMRNNRRPAAYAYRRASFILSSTMKEEAPATGGNRGFRFHVGEPVMGRDYPSHSLFMSSNATGKPIALTLAAVLPHSRHCRLFL